MRFSIIVPVYNVEKYLKQCIESLINQNFEDYEIILVDDGSTDLSGKICDDYCKNYDIIKSFHKKNGGLSDARNFGINKSTGEYLIFIDSDDYISFNYFLQDISKMLDNSDYDLIVYGRKKYFENIDKYGDFSIFKEKKNAELIESLIKCNFFKASACDKVIKRKIVMDNKLFFRVGMTGEDIKWCGDVLKCIDLHKVGLYNDIAYVYRQRNNSISTSKTNKKNMVILIDLFEKEILQGKDFRTKVVNSYYAYEYAVRLGKIYANDMKDFEQSYKQRMLNLKGYLEYDLSDRVKKIELLSYFIGIKKTAKILALYIDYKRKKISQ